MLNNNRILYIYITIFLLNSLACESDLPEITWEGRYVKVGASENLEVFGKTYDALDDRIHQLMNRTELNFDNKIIYYWLNENEAKDVCGGGRLGCQQYHVVISADPMDDHEIVHVLLESNYRTHRFLSEGFAVYFDGIPMPVFDVTINSIDDQLVPYISRESVDYEAAGLFTSYLINQYGKESFYKICQLISPGADRIVFNSVLKHVLDKNLERLGKTKRLFSDYRC